MYQHVSLETKYIIVDECHDDGQCPNAETCVHNKCQDPCLALQCGVNAECKPANHKAICSCLKNHKGDPYTHCRKYECIVNTDCNTHLACRNEQCVDPCATSGMCAKNAECRAVAHTPKCSCADGWGGNAYIKCVKCKFSFLCIAQLYDRLRL